MNLYLTIFILCGSIFVAQSKSVEADGKAIFCYFESWTIYRPGNGKFDIDNIDPNLCTHIAFTFLGIHEDGSIWVLDPWESDPDGLDGFRRVVALKQTNPNLKVLISMGGWNEGSIKYSEVVADPAKRAVLVEQVVAIIEKYGFDGFDFDWEYPARRDSTNPADKQNFVLILQELKAAFQPKGWILSAAVNAGKSNIDISYDVPAINAALDYINVMTYDFHGAFDNYVGHHTPLYAASVDAEHGLAEWNIDAGIQYWIELGASPAKINLGLATYARTFTLQDATKTELYAAISGGGTAGPYTRQDGILGYNEICELHPGVPDVWDDEQKVPHKVIGNQWYGYESTESLAIKVNYAVEKQLGGFMVWSFDTDDFRGLCGGGAYPLINTIHTTLAKAGYKLKNNN